MQPATAPLYKLEEWGGLNVQKPGRDLWLQRGYTARRITLQLVWIILILVLQQGALAGYLLKSSQRPQDLPPDTAVTIGSSK
ncbi:hypothetical protein N7474_005464 [Penicillium riverlandense]|uniref:uncharacterized protein n=1 Tax=Penicillium riverlandense TaxID=1903569 RepID=UPI002547C486|nr:uncharacterized protein N7474_005464 [Penicillium riverlandense]KAJ5819873.1 hypothetical protein N7474_005464 [Penicillium riverlandense]